MSAPITKDQLGFSLGNLSYIDASFDEGAAPLVKPQDRKTATWVARLLAKLVEWRHRRRVIAEMAMMTDHELADIGLSRADLGRVFDPAFVADYTRGRDYIAY